MTKKEAIKYLQQLYPNGGHCWLDERRIEAIGMAVKTLQDEPVSEDLEEAARKIATRHSHITGDTYYANDAWLFKKGAQWQAEQFEKNRLAACDAQTREEAEREWNFVEQMINEEHRKPTYSDAIEYGMNLMKERMMNDAVDAYISDEITGKSLRFDSDALMAAWSKYEVGTKLKLIIVKD